MKLFIVVNKTCVKIVLFILIGVMAALAASPLNAGYVFFDNNVDENEITAVLEDYFRQRGTALVSGDPTFIEGQFDTSSTYGKWSYEHELKRIKYIKNWSYVRGVKFMDCEPSLKIFSIKQGQGWIRVYMSVRTRMTYIYPGMDDDKVNEFCLGTRHTIKLVNINSIWHVTVDWYSDPLEDYIEANPDSPAPAAAVDVETPAFSSKVSYNRTKAVEYADKYCGAFWNSDEGYKYNKKYRNYADLGGDCANFASQVLADKDAGGLSMGGAWAYRKGSGSKAWVNAGAFTNHLLYSGKAKLVAKGNYEKVVSSINYLSPGDIVAYEKKGKIVHVSIVTAKDSQGTLMVNSHTNDRYHVPWDLGWNGGRVKFWLVRING